MNKAYVDSIDENRTDKLVREKFDEEYINFKKAMVSKSPIDVFESCYKIAAMEDVYFYVTESKIFTPEEKEYILNSGDCVLTDLMQDWYDYGDWNDRVSDSVENTFSERMGEYQKSLDNSEDCIDGGIIGYENSGCQSFCRSRSRENNMRLGNCFRVKETGHCDRVCA